MKTSCVMVTPPAQLGGRIALRSRLQENTRRRGFAVGVITHDVNGVIRTADHQDRLHPSVAKLHIVPLSLKAHQENAVVVIYPRDCDRHQAFLSP
ncbi:MAG: hypothetical protein ABI700_05210, partial [Chloroflexota bacterium]